MAAGGSYDRLAAAVSAVSPERWLGVEGIAPLVADGRFRRWIDGLRRLDPQPGERIGVGGGAAPWALALLAHLVGPQGEVWVIGPPGLRGWLARWQARRLPGWVRFGPPRGIADGLWWPDGPAGAGPRLVALRPGGRAVCGAEAVGAAPSGDAARVPAR